MKNRITRRNVLKIMVVAAAICASSNLLSVVEPWKLRYALASSLFGVGPIEEILAVMKSTEADFVEIRRRLGWPNDRHGSHGDERTNRRRLEERLWLCFMNNSNRTSKRRKKSVSSLPSKTTRFSAVAGRDAGNPVRRFYRDFHAPDASGHCDS